MGDDLNLCLLLRRCACCITDGYICLCARLLSVCNCASIAPKAILVVVSLLDFAIWLIIMPGLMLNNMPDRLVALVSTVY